MLVAKNIDHLSLPQWNNSSQGVCNACSMPRKYSSVAPTQCWLSLLETIKVTDEIDVFQKRENERETERNGFRS